MKKDPKQSELSNSFGNDVSKLTAQWALNPKLYFKQQLGIEVIWKLQADLLEACPVSIATRKPIYLASGHALGKDYTCGGIGCWFLDSFNPSTVILTGPTHRQVKNIMWLETVSKWNARKFNLWGRVFQTCHIEVNKDQKWYLMGFTTKETGSSSQAGGAKLQGIHNKNVCVIVTESQAVEENIRDQIDAISTAQNILLLFVGNPTATSGWFHKGLKNKRDNIVFNFSCLENPNYKHRKIIIPGLCPYEWVEDKRKKWGTDDPRWQSRVEGRSPDVSISRVFPEDTIDLMKAKYTYLSRFSFNRGVAVDSSGEGADDNVFMSGSGGEVVNVYTVNNIAPSVAAIRAVEMCKEIAGIFIIVDCDGIGIAVYQELAKLPPEYLDGIIIVKFHGSSRIVEAIETQKDKKGNSEKKRLYYNKRAEAAFIARDRAKRGAASVNPKDEELLEDLEADLWFEDKKTGQLRILEKEDIKEALGGRSPGRGDCFKMLQYAFELSLKSRRDQNTKSMPKYAVTDGVLTEGAPTRPSAGYGTFGPYAVND